MYPYEIILELKKKLKANRLSEFIVQHFLQNIHKMNATAINIQMDSEHLKLILNGNSRCIMNHAKQNGYTVYYLTLLLHEAVQEGPVMSTRIGDIEM